MSLSSNPSGGSSRTSRRDPWTILDGLLQTLTGATSTSTSISATVEALAEAVSADVAFWYSRSSGQALAVVGQVNYSAAACASFAKRLLDRVPAEHDVAVWKNPDTQDEGEPLAALVCQSARTNGAVVAMNFEANRPFAETDVKMARLTLKMLLSQRAQSLAGTKQLLMGLLHSLTTIIDAKDPFTAGHSERVARISALLCKQMNLAPALQSDVYLAALLHNVGNIGLRDDVLQKPGRLTREELEELQQHPILSERIVQSIKPFDRLKPAVRHHHERWDGEGYPDRLAREQIPLIARILAVADACDAMMSARRYRPAKSPIDIDAVFQRESGKQFDPAVVQAFFAIRHEVYPPIYQKGLGESASHALDHIVENMTDASVLKLPAHEDSRRG
jgi:HD-GYP domain-containing protein (c-di-GMP phosphodiesterase class II)